MYQIVGIEKKAWEMNGKTGFTYWFYCIGQDKEVMGGMKTMSFKMKEKELSEFVDITKLQDLLKTNLSKLLYDEYKNVVAWK